MPDICIQIFTASSSCTPTQNYSLSVGFYCTRGIHRACIIMWVERIAPRTLTLPSSFLHWYFLIFRPTSRIILLLLLIEFAMPHTRSWLTIVWTFLRPFEERRAIFFSCTPAGAWEKKTAGAHTHTRDFNYRGTRQLPRGYDFTREGGITFQ